MAVFFFSSFREDSDVPRGDQPIDHLLRRAGFGATPGELASYGGMSLSAAIAQLINYQQQPDDVDAKIGQDGYLSVTARGGQFSPNTNIEDARQRWLFRTVHSARPLQEKMALFWHNHFATAYSKITGVVGQIQATKMLALVPNQLPGPQGQLELFRSLALGKFRDLLVEVSRDPAMLVWLDGRLNTRTRPQENFGREIMELFTFGIGNYTEQDVYAAARVFTGWNLRLSPGGNNNDPDAYYEFFYNANQHDTTPKTFTFPVYADGRQTIPARAAAEGMQDGLDFIAALARHPETARRLARKLWDYFVSDREVAPPAFIEGAADVYLRNDTEIRPLIDYVLRSSWFHDSSSLYARYSWPVEFVARAVKETGWQGFSIDNARTPLANMGQTLFEPPDVNGWELGAGWISTGAMLARMNFATTLATNQRLNLARAVPASSRTSADRFTTALIDRFTPRAYSETPRAALLGYVTSGGAWTGSETQVNTKAPSVARLVLGSAEYQFV